jgi:hypothetical protein
MVFLSASSGNLRTGSVEAKNNGTDGILIWSASDVQMQGGVTLTLHNNGRDGLILFNGASMFTTGTISSSGNGRDGIRGGESTAFTVLPGASVSSTNNTSAGLDLRGLGRSVILPGARLEGNDIGVSMIEGSSATLFGMTIQGNGTDISVGFASHATITLVNDPTMVTVNCEATALLNSTSSVACP